MVPSKEDKEMNVTLIFERFCVTSTINSFVKLYTHVYSDSKSDITNLYHDHINVCSHRRRPAKTQGRV